MDNNLQFDPKIHHRRSIRLQGYDYSQSGAYFVTIVTYGRECLFGEIQNGEMQLSDYGRIADENWHAIPAHFPQIELGEFVIMPNHLHGILIVGATHWVAPTPIASTPINSTPVVHSRISTKPVDSISVAHTPISYPVDGHTPVAPANTKPDGPKRGSIGAIIGAYKMSVTRRILAEVMAQISGSVIITSILSAMMMNLTGFNSI